MAVGQLTPKILLAYLGLSFQEKSNRLSLRCPFHDDRDPSAGFYIDSEKFFCFTCSLSLDMVGFYAKFHGLTRIRAEVDLEQQFGVQIANDKEARKEQAEKIRRSAERTIKDLAKLGTKEQTRKEEDLERILWLYEEGKFNEQAFLAAVRLWKMGLGEQEQKEPSPVLE